MTIVRDLDLNSLVLDTGSHKAGGAAMCVMEAAAYIAGEPWSDHPTCVSPVITSFLISWNDNLGAEGRQKLKPYIPKVLGTVGTPEQEQARGLMAADWFIRHHLPAWLELAGLQDIAGEVRRLPSLDSWDGLTGYQPILHRAKRGAAAARDAAWDDAWAAARDAAWAAASAAARAAAGAAAWAAAWAAASGSDAAWAAARAAAGDAAWDAAWAAAGAAARDAAAGDAAWDAAAGDAAWDAAWAAAGAALKPRVVSLQQSAFDLLDRMIAATENQ